jgi:hypothetical protein
VQLLNAQNKKITGIIKDAKTLEPIEFVNIYFENDSNNNLTGSISNELGEFSIGYSNVTFSHINYESLTINLGEGFVEILLEPKEFILDEIVISSISARDYLKAVIKNADNKLEKKTLFKGYCREIVEVNKNYTKISDAMVDFYIKKRNGKSKVVLKEHRAFHSEEIENQESSLVDNIDSAFELKNYVKDAYDFKDIKEILKNEEYDFERNFKKESNGEEYEYIKIVPNSESRQMLDEGYVIIDPETKNILEYKIYTSKSHLNNAKVKNFLIAKATIKSKLKWSKFKILNNQYILTYNKRQGEIHIEIGDKVNDNFNFISDLFIYEFKNNLEIPKNTYNENTIYEAGTNYKNEFWKNYNLFPLTKNQQNFINTAKVKKTNAQQ